VITGRDHHMPTAGTGTTAQKSIVQLLRPIARSAVIKDVPGHQQSLGPLAFNTTEQPVEKELEFPVAFPAVERPPDMPVRGMQHFHVMADLCFAT